MEGDTLYSVKWYRNEQEFFRYVPNDRPKLQIFPQEGIRVEVKPGKIQDSLLSSPSPSPQIPIPIGTGADTKVLWATTTTTPPYNF